MAQTTPCKVYKQEGGAKLIGWSPGVKGTLTGAQLQPPWSSQLDPQNRKVPWYGGEGKPAKYDPAENPGVCPWVDFEATPEEMANYLDCQSLSADNCLASSKGAADRDQAFDQCLTERLDQCDALIASKKKTPPAAPKPPPPGPASEPGPEPAEEPKEKKQRVLRRPPTPALEESTHPAVRLAAARRKEREAGMQSEERFKLKPEEQQQLEVLRGEKMPLLPEGPEEGE